VRTAVIAKSSEHGYNWRAIWSTGALYCRCVSGHRVHVTVRTRRGCAYHRENEVERRWQKL